MILIYNENGFHDTLVCVLQKQDETKMRSIENKGDVVLLRQDNELIGINIKRASEKFSTLPHGIDLHADVTEDIQTYILKETNIRALPSTLNQQFVIGEVKEKDAHPDSDKLSVTQVDVGTEVLQIVCGASNVARGQRVVVAQIGSMMPNGLLIEPSVLRKVESLGMICSAKELNLPTAFHAPGILVLPTDAPVGYNFVDYFGKEMMVK